MSKRALLTYVLAASALAVCGITLNAHYERIVNGVLIHQFSYDCAATLERGNPSSNGHDATAQCTSIATEIQYICANNKVTQGNNIRTEIVSTAGTSLSEEIITENGTVDLRIDLPNNVMAVAEAGCQARNGKNWHAVAELILKSDLFIQVFESEGQASEAWFHCGAAVDENGVPLDLITNPPPGGGVDTPYPCFVVAVAHCDRFPETCPIEYTPELFALRQEGSERPYNLNAGIHSLWKQARKVLSMDRNVPQPTKLAQATRNKPNM
jgi:hypothetical protein